MCTTAGGCPQQQEQQQVRTIHVDEGLEGMTFILIIVGDQPTLQEDEWEGWESTEENGHPNGTTSKP